MSSFQTISRKLFGSGSSRGEADLPEPRRDQPPARPDRETSKTRAAPKAAAFVFLEGHGEEKPAEWYDSVFASSSKYAKHYTRTTYYALWSVVADRLLRSGRRSIVEIACGTGQLASLLRDKGLTDYHGVDFSPVAIEKARERCPELSFAVEDVLGSALLEQRTYDVVVCLEFLEHVHEDRRVLQRIRPGALVFASVPNFSADAHVRYFSSEEEVVERYRDLFDSFSVDTHLVSVDKGTKYFLIEGIRRGGAPA